MKNEKAELRKVHAVRYNSMNQSFSFRPHSFAEPDTPAYCGFHDGRRCQQIFKVAKMFGLVIALSMFTSCQSFSAAHSREIFDVTLLSWRERDESFRPPFLLVIEQRFYNEKPDAIHAVEFTVETQRALQSALRMRSKSDLKLGWNHVTIINEIYEFTPPGKRVVLSPASFANLTNSFPFHELIIGPQGAEIHP